ncbi:hypothetical protein IU460_27355 [Nocardia farcinica]|nr:hypothetical protein [Nocardia farcinica]
MAACTGTVCAPIRTAVVAAQGGPPSSAKNSWKGHRRALVAGTAESRAQLTGLVTSYLRGVRGR